MTTLTNSAEGGTGGTTVTTGNSGGTSGNAFDTVTIGTSAALIFDGTHAAHGTLAYEASTGATSATSFAQWDVSMGTQGQVWFRQYLYFTANPAAAYDVFEAASAGGLCAGVQLATNGTLIFRNASGTAIFTTTATIPLNQWFRIEGFVIGSATVGQVELKLFKTADSVTPDETDTSTAVQNTRGSMTQYRYGIETSRANATAFWQDDLGLSSTGYLGPAVSVPSGSVQPHATVPLPRRYPARGQWAGQSTPQPHIAGQIQPPATRPARRTAARAVAYWTPVSTVNAVGPVSVPPSAASSGWSVTRRQPVSAVWGGYASSLVPAGTAAPAGTVQPQATFPLPRRTSARVLWRGQSTPQPHVPGQVQPRATVPVPRRYPARGQWQGQSTPQPHVAGQVQPRPVVARRTPARAAWSGTTVRTVNAAPPPAGTVQPRATVPVPRRGPQRVIWRGNAVPGVQPQPATGGLVRRRTPARALWRTVTGPGNAHGPNGQVQPKPVIARRAAARAAWKGTVTPGSVAIGPQPLFRHGQPYFQWDTETPGFRWETGSPAFQWDTGVPVTS